MYQFPHSWLLLGIQVALPEKLQYQWMSLWTDFTVTNVSNSKFTCTDKFIFAREYVLDDTALDLE